MKKEKRKKQGTKCIEFEVSSTFFYNFIIIMTRTFTIFTEIDIQIAGMLQW